MNLLIQKSIFHLHFHMWTQLLKLTANENSLVQY